MSKNENWKIVSLLVALAIVSTVAFAFKQAYAASTAEVWTDKQDYSPGETVIVYGSGFNAFSNVTVTVERPDGTLDFVYAVSDSLGAFSCPYQLDGIVGIYTVTATDGTNTATTTFTDGSIQLELSGYTLEPQPKWTHGDVKGYYEDEWVPYKIEVTNNKTESYQLTVVVHLDYFDGTYYALDNIRNFVGPGSVSGPVVNGWESGIQQLEFNWTFNISKDEICTLTFEVHIAIGAYNYPGSKVHVRIADIISSPSTSISSGHRDVPIAVEGPRGADVAVQKSGVNYAHEGDIITFQFTVINNGNGTAYNVQVIDDLLGNLTDYLPDTTLTNGEINTFSVNYIVPSSSGDITNTVTVNSTTPDPNPSNNQASWTVDILHPAIDVTKSGSQYAHEGEAKTYTITVKNTGDCPLYNVTVSDDLLGSIYSGGLAVGETKIFTVSYTVPTPSGDVINNVTASGEDVLGNEVTDEASWTVDVLHPALIVVKEANATVISEGDLVRYNVTVVNVGDCDLNVMLSDDLLGISWSGTLVPGGKHEIIMDYMPTTFPAINNASATATDAAGGTVSASASWTVTKAVVPTARVTFGQVGVGNDFTGVVLTVDGVDYHVTELPVDFDWDVGSNHTFEFYSPLVVDASCKRYVWTSTSGLTTTQNGSLVVPEGGGSVTGYYKVQYYLTVKTDPPGLVSIPGSDWYDKCTYVNLMAPQVTGYIFVYWDVDGTNVTGNPITVHMDNCHTATAHYATPPAQVSEVTCCCSVTDGKFVKINRFTTVFSLANMRLRTYRLISTRPNAFYFVIKLNNTGSYSAGPVVVGFQLDPEFVLVGADPVQVHTGWGRTGTRITATVVYDPATKVGTVTIDSMSAGQVLYITMSMDYAFKGQTFTRSEVLNWVNNHPSNTFTCTLQSPNSGQCSVTVKDPPLTDELSGIAIQHWIYYTLAVFALGLGLLKYALRFKRDNKKR